MHAGNELIGATTCFGAGGLLSNYLEKCDAEIQAVSFDREHRQEQADAAKDADCFERVCVNLLSC